MATLVKLVKQSISTRDRVKAGLNLMRSHVTPPCTLDHSMNGTEAGPQDDSTRRMSTF